MDLYIKLGQLSNHCSVFFMINICFVGIFHHEYGTYKVLGVHVSNFGRSWISKVISFVLLTISLSCSYYVTLILICDSLLMQNKDPNLS